MRIGILSDTHNHKTNTRAALGIFRQEGVTKLIHCGDLTSGEIVLLFAGWEVTFVYGNGDQNRSELHSAVKRIGRPLPGLTATLIIDGVSIGVMHGHHSLPRLIGSGEHRYVLHGHTHIRRDEVIDGVRVINPGALGGRHRQTRSVAVLDVEADDLRFIELEE